jgi:shikimate dehydrogenase
MPAPIKKACLISWPSGHSRSPLIHGYWLKQHGIAGCYTQEAVPPEALAGFIAGLAEKGYAGANVSLPHKEAALLLSKPDARARAVGAANTLFFDQGVLCSTNTDVEGFLASLDQAKPGWEHKTSRAVVIGAGGAARAILFGLIERGVRHIDLANRNIERARTLADAFGPSVAPRPLSMLQDLLDGAGLLVNTSSLGMKGQPALEVDLSPLPAQALVSDIVYVPLTTPLLAAAHARGLAVADGLDMLLHQAVRGFSLWFGQTPRVTPELRALVRADLGEAG